ncbi:MAG: PAS domain S-box protein, partial [Desulfobacteraceae bacterium]
MLEQELAQSQIKYKTIADFAGDWEWWLSPAGEFQYMSPSCKDITGYTAEEFIENAWLIDRIIHPGDAGEYGIAT